MTEGKFEEHFKRVYKLDEIGPKVYDSVAFMFYEYGTRENKERIGQLESRLAEAEAVIKFYGNGKWEEFISSGGIFGTSDGDQCWAFNGSGDNDGDDAGQKARQYLEKYKGDE